MVLTCCHRPCRVILIIVLASLQVFLGDVSAQVITSITPTTGSGNLNTTVTQSGSTYNITGGTRPGGGSNLFHSFGSFSIGAADTANFLNTPVNGSLPLTTNILGRVTGGDVSNIFGGIQTTGYGNANLFLMNPAGFLFGPGATVNVGGMVTFATADYLRLTDGGRFNASSNPVVPDLLTAAPVAAFGFLGSNPGAIAVQGSHLTVTEGSGISLIGGPLTIQSGTLEDGMAQPARLSAPGGEINLASVASPGELSASNFLPTPGMTMGNTNVSQDSLLDVSGNAAGSVHIRGGNLVIDDATITADTGDANATPVAVDINLTGDLTISDIRSVSAITARTLGDGNAGKVQITSRNFQVTSTDPVSETFALIDSHSSGNGGGGNVTIATENLSVSGPGGAMHFIDSGPQAAGPGGNITIVAQHNIELTGTTISTGTQLAEIVGAEASGPAGNLTVSGDRLVTDNAFLLTTATFGAETQQAGSVTLNVRDISMANSSISAAGFFGGGAITITAENLVTDATQLDTFTAFGPAQGITFTGRVLELRNGSTWSTSTFGDSSAGDIRIEASDHVALLGNNDTPTGVFSNSFGDFGSLGGSGNIIVNTPKLTMITGRMNTSTATSGRGGDVTINADTIEISGEFPLPDSGAFFGITDIRPSGLFTQTVGAEFCAGPCGNAGNISITTGSLTMGPGSQIDSGTSSAGLGGNITIHATDSIALSGTLTDGTPGGIFSRTIGADPDAGSGGNITLAAGQSVTISEGAQVSASTTGPGNAGNITIQGLASPAQSVVVDGFGSGVLTDTQDVGAGGNIFVNADSVTLSNGGTLSATTSGSGNAGDIRVAGEEISLTGLSSNISALTLGDGNAGNILLEVGQLTMTDEANVLASTEGAGHGGNITIHGPSGSGSVAENVVLNGLSTLDATSILGSGSAGNVTINTARLTVANESQITSSSQQGSGPAGNVILNGTESITVSGGFVFSASLIGSTGNGGQVTITTPSLAIDAGSTGFGGNISTSTSGVGQAGDVTINTGTLTLSNGGQLTSNSSILGLALPTGSGGTVTVRGLQASGSQANSVTISGSDNFGNQSGIFTKTEGTGKGGNISINANTVTLQNGSEVSSSSTGTGTAGNIDITADNQLTMANSSITTEATKSSGGIIKITTDPSGTVELTNSMISASVLDGTGGGGSVSIDPQFVILQNSQILAEAEQGPGGNILINITNGGLFLPDATSKVSASSQFGQQGTVTIQAPIAPAGGKIQPLGKAPIQVTALLSQRCAAIARGEVSSFVVAGRDTLPTEPGGWLTSPLASVPTDSGSTVQAGNPAISSHLSDPMMLSLRRLPSSAKLARILSDDWLSDCGGHS